MQRRLRVNRSTHKLETIHESDQESSESTFTPWNDNKTINKSTLNQITTFTVDQFLCLTEENFYELSCTLEYLEFCEAKLSTNLTSLYKRTEKCLKKLKQFDLQHSKTGTQ
ncbi:Hypothetical_protein [Hexamita inflata]|uniref:Hypothetical_protein n=1 Tax=Hexamita inflata TaxID=28002 RepID=A0AA86QWZ7_9EUKA|nr:Hypothetical protein HINF_LOCUS49957 [Hexamita inflata]